MDTRSSIRIIGFLYFSACLCRGFPNNSTDKIINGSDANIQSVPYMLSFMLNGQYICCAAIINRYWVVTAAHCVREVNFDDEVTVRSGSSVLYRDGTVHVVNEILIHEYYNVNNNDYDIAVMRVTPPFTYNEYTNAVGLAPYNDQDVFVQQGLVCGWGYYKKTDDTVDPVLSEQLQCVILPLINKDECYQDYENRYTLTPRMTCYGFEEGKADSCQGDSGSPLVNKDNILIGITSWGDGCAKAYSPGVYADAVVLRNWIADNTGT